MRPLSLEQEGTAPTQAKALTDEQELAASRRKGSMLLTAAAGSGKTSVLVERFVRAAVDDGIEPARVLAITFTERAAWELKERVRSRLQELGLSELARDAEAASIGTIHGFCARLLRTDPLAADLAPDFRILDEPTALRIRVLAFREALRAISSQASAAELDAIAAYGPDRLQAIVLRVHAELRSRGEETPRLPPPRAGAANAPAAVAGPADALGAHAMIAALLERFCSSYEAHKHARGAVDFDDLELRALGMLEREPALRRRWTERFDVLMVDEFQDTNPRQLALLLALERENLFTVGDEWQSIYGFRHADVKIFRSRATELLSSDASLALTRNFRSRPAILNAVNAAFAARFGERFKALEPARPPGLDAPVAVEVLLTNTRGWEQDSAAADALSLGLPQAPAWRQAEALLVARRLARLIDEGDAQPGEIAVLLRSMTDVSIYEAALRMNGVPTCSVSGELWEAFEVQDLLCWLRAIANPLDEVALHGVLAGPAVGLSADALWLLSGAADANDVSGGLWRSIRELGETALDLPAADAARLARFQERFSGLRSEVVGHTLSALVGAAWAEAWPGTPAPASISTLRRLAGDFEAFEGRDLRAFIEHLEHLAQARTALGGQAPVVEGETVRLMSIHAAKGLEFPVVCIADLGRGANGREVPHLLVDGDRVGLKVARLDGSAPEPAFDYEQLASERALAEDEEEDRILYVAMTRAEEMLLLSGAASFERWPAQTRSAAPIAWLAPTLVEDLPERLARAMEGDVAAYAARRGDPEASVACILNAPIAGAVQWPAGRSATTDDAAQVVAGGGLPITDAVQGAAVDSLPDARPARGSTDDDVRAGVAETALEVLSYTALSQLERCGYRYYLERVLGLGELDSIGGRGRRSPGQRSRDRRSSADRRLTGLIAHRMMEGYDFARGAEPTVEDAIAAAEGIGERVDRAEAGEAVAMLSGLRETALGRRLARARSIATEQPFCFALSAKQGSLAGAFDALAIERDGTHLVVDYKTDSVAAADDLEQLVVRDYEMQRLVYALAALRNAGATGSGVVEVVHWFLRRPQQPVHARFGVGELEPLEARLAARVAAARRRGFAVSTSPQPSLCTGCPGRGSLCSWPASATMSE